MAVRVGDLEGRLRLDSAAWDNGIQRAQTGLQRLSKQSYSLQSALVVMAGAAGIGYASKKVFALGAAVEETASKFNTVFGKSTKNVQEFIDNFGTMAGLSQTAAREVLATTGAIVQGMGLAQDASARYATEVVKLAGDLSSFNNIPIAETSRAIQAAITGEREQLKRLGVVILETDVQKRALLDTGKKNATALTQEERAVATLALITERAGVAMGDLVRTQDSSANRARKVGAEFKNVAETLSTSLMPALTSVLGLIITLTDKSELWVRRLGDGIRFVSAELSGTSSQFLAIRDSILATLAATPNKEETLARRLVGDTQELRQVEAVIDGLGKTIESLGGRAAAEGAGVGGLVAKFDEAKEQAEVLRLTIGFVKDEILKLGSEAPPQIDNMTDATGDLAVGLGKVNANLIDTATLARRAAAALRSRGMAVTGSEAGLSLPAGRIGAGGASTLGTDPVTARLTPVVTEAVSALQRFKDGLKTVGSNLGDFLKERFDPTQFITDLASSGISAALGFAAGKIGEMFGQSEEEAAMAAALESNKISLDRLRGSIDRQANVMSQMPGGIFEAARTAINEAMTWHPWGNLGGFFTIDMKKVREAMDRLGLTMGDLERIAEILNMEFVNTAEGIKALAAALNNLSVSDLFATVSGGLDMLRREFEFRDFTPVRQLQRVRDFLVARAGLGAEGERLQRLDLTTAEGRAELQIIIMSIFERILSGGLALGAMGEFNITEFLDILGWLESLGDSIDDLEEEVDGTTEAFRDLQEELLNVPSGFKIALARFGATTGVLPDTSGTGPGTVRTDPPGGGGGIVPPGMFASIGAASPSSIISVENVTVVAAQGESASDLWARMEAAARKEARRGGTSNLDLAVR